MRIERPATRTDAPSQVRFTTISRGEKKSGRGWKPTLAAKKPCIQASLDQSERDSTAAYTNTARCLTRPIAPLIAAATLRGALGAPFFIAGTLKCQSCVPTPR